MNKVPPAPSLSKGCVVHCRSHRWLVEEEPETNPQGDTVVRLAKKFRALPAVTATAAAPAAAPAAA
jgi:hypothetical protein